MKLSRLVSTPARTARRGTTAASARAAARRHRKHVRWLPLAYVPAVVACARQRRRWGPPPAAVTLGAVYATPAVISYALPRGRARAGLGWLAHMWAYKVAFEVPYDRPAELRRRLRVEAPIAIDRWIGRGVPPSQRLQRRLRRPPELNLLDRAASAVYLLWEIEPHLALGWVLLRHPKRFPAAALRIGATFDATLVGYFATPTAPPWWAGEFQGRMDGEVRRVNAEVIRALQRQPRPGSPQDHEWGSNPWAAWPSDHFASALSTAFALAEADRRAGTAGFAYAALLGLTLVYTGEHYVIDLLLGAVLALGIHGAGAALTGKGLKLLERTVEPGSRPKRLRRAGR